ncbi:hypothetical protein HUJ05_002721 [Dendroctonus ponderosae]|nr:hypothetical protein HUJ05_002721 [Dendroctonus ponderosae]
MFYPYPTNDFAAAILPCDLHKMRRFFKQVAASQINMYVMRQLDTHIKIPDYFYLWSRIWYPSDIRHSPIQKGYFYKESLPAVMLRHVRYDSATHAALYHLPADYHNFKLVDPH